jgi:hypothetical protein
MTKIDRPMFSASNADSSSIRRAAPIATCGMIEKGVRMIEKALSGRTRRDHSLIHAMFRVDVDLHGGGTAWVSGFKLTV